MVVVEVRLEPKEAENLGIEFADTIAWDFQDFLSMKETEEKDENDDNDKRGGVDESDRVTKEGFTIVNFTHEDVAKEEHDLSIRLAITEKLFRAFEQQTEQNLSSDKFWKYWNMALLRLAPADLKCTFDSKNNILQMDLNDEQAKTLAEFIDELLSADAGTYVFDVAEEPEWWSDRGQARLLHSIVQNFPNVVPQNIQSRSAHYRSVLFKQ